jgi:hypothetical protein
VVLTFYHFSKPKIFELYIFSEGFVSIVVKNQSKTMFLKKEKKINPEDHNWMKI